MKISIRFIIILFFFVSSCSSKKQLTYLNNLPVQDGEEFFTLEIPDYKIQPRDVLYISARAMNTEGAITEYLSGGRSAGGSNNMQYESTQYLSGYDVDSRGNLRLPIIGEFKAEGLTTEILRDSLQQRVEKIYPNSSVECKLLSFKFTVIGEIKTPGTYTNYNNYLTVLEAIGRAGGVTDFGRKDNVLVIRASDKGSKTFKLNLQDKKILASEAYFLLPNDVVIVEPVGHKIFNLNLPTIAFTITTVTSILTTTLLLIDYFGSH